jgi:hypothetical protein
MADPYKREKAGNEASLPAIPGHPAAVPAAVSSWTSPAGNEVRFT